MTGLLAGGRLPCSILVGLHCEQLRLRGKTFLCHVPQGIGFAKDFFFACLLVSSLLFNGILINFDLVTERDCEMTNLIWDECEL